METIREAFTANSDEALLDAAGLDEHFEVETLSPMVIENIDFA
ncbi:hypothetical protein [Streptomyces sp. WM6378]|nr:hypothetical protein [Streptomyces sp. WM6378]